MKCMGQQLIFCDKPSEGGSLTPLFLGGAAGWPKLRDKQTMMLGGRVGIDDADHPCNLPLMPEVPDAGENHGNIVRISHLD